ncbi:MAG: hypothetical protein V2A65_08845 [Candidatus Omnitrophota bacterium]
MTIKKNYHREVRDSLEGAFFVVDNLKGKRYPLPLSVTEFQKTGDFNSRIKLSLDHNRIRVNFSSRDLKGKTRDIGYTIRIPLPESLYPWNLKWKIWTATKGYPKWIFDLPATYFVDYGSPDGASLIPGITIYNPEEDTGLTLLNSLNVRTPMVRFIVKREERYIDAELSCFMLTEENQTEAEFNFYFHQGDWRCGLKKIYKDYPDYFEPNNPSVNKIYINLTQTGWEKEVHHDRAYIENTLKTTNKDVGINFSEIHHYFPRYGMYMPEDADKGWIMEALVSQGVPGVPMTLKKMHRHLKDLKELGIRPLLYFQPVGDCERRLAYKRFPDAIVKDSAGRECPCGSSIICNSDQNTSFGKDMRRQLRRLLKEFEDDADGIFWDNLCFGYFDYSHSDGISMIDGKPVYRLTFAYEQFGKELLPYLKKKGRFVFGNGPYNVEVGKGIDCVMAEAHPWLIEHFAYLCIARPLNVFYYTWETKNITEYEEMFQASLLWGAFPSARIDINTREIHGLYLKYKRFFELLIGKRWVLEKEPIKMIKGWKGNIFKNLKGYAAFVIKELQGFTTEGSLKVSLKVHYDKRDNRIKVIGISGKKLNYDLKRSGDYLDFEIKNPESVNALLIENKKEERLVSNKKFRGGQHGWEG